MTTQHEHSFDLESVRARLSAARGPQYWRSLEELAATEGFQQFLHREFPRQASEWTDPVSRRQFFKLMGASLALAGLSSCSSHEPPERIVPYVRQPEEVIPGKPLFYATAMSLGGSATGLLVESHLGRPTKIEGNPDHPASLGATDLFAQASVLTLYDPDRAQTVTYLGQPSSRAAFHEAFRAALDRQRTSQGAGLRILTETVNSPTLAAQLRGFLKTFPRARWHQYEPAGRDQVHAGARLAFGEESRVSTQYRFEKAERILSLDADFLSCGPGNLRYTRDFSDRRRVTGGENPGGMNRLYVVECTPTNTGAKADHRLALRAREIEGFARSIAARLGVEGVQAEREGPSASHAKWIAALARDLEEYRGRSIVIAGDQQLPLVHALAHAMNAKLGNVGKTIVYTDAVEAEPIDQMQSLRELVEEMKADTIEMLIVLGGNPVYTAPADIAFADSLERFFKDSTPEGGFRRFSMHLGLYEDETSRLCEWHVPETHYLEAWSDARAYDGTVSIAQPLIAPLYSGASSAHELLAAFTEKPERTGYDIVREHWMSQHSAGDFEEFWRQALDLGKVPDTALPEKKVSLQPNWMERAHAAEGRTRAAASEGENSLEIVFRPDPTIYDGRFANNGWLQELPKPLTKLTWDNAALMSPRTAERFGLSTSIAWRGGEHGQVHADVVKLHYQDRSVDAPVFIVQGHPDDSVTVHLGYGRTRAGQSGTGAGFNAYALRTWKEPWSGAGLTIEKTNRTDQLACTQNHHLMEGRNLVRSAPLGEKNQLAHEIQSEREELERGTQAERKPQAPERPASLYGPGYQYKGYAWGMAIDVNACVGCNACVVACQAENNIPVVGKEQVMVGREMHWLRVDTYYQGDPKQPESLETYHQPVPCMHCENAPCELVCPVGATVHSSEGTNDMVYNRCVGTRYCSNNCPYKVRRFNFFEYAKYQTPSLKLLNNPDVTVRSRGVMEKCTYCIQRINNARIEAEKGDRSIQDGEVVTACQAVCPARAIVFGDINDEKSLVSKLKKDPLNYGLLAELNTRPRTSYLAAFRNPNPEIG